MTTLADLESLPAIVSQLQARVAELEARLTPSTPAIDLVDAETAAVLLGMTPGAVRAAARRGTVPCVHIGRSVRFSRAVLASTR